MWGRFGPHSFCVWIGAGGPPEIPTAEADQIAPLYWDLHTQRDEAGRVFTV
jgi:hypothetical protein